MVSVPQMTDLSLGERIRVARKSRGVSIAALAAVVGVSRESMSDYELDRTDPPARVIRRLAEELETSADWLLFGATRVKRKGRASTFKPQVIEGRGLDPGGPSPIAVALPSG